MITVNRILILTLILAAFIFSGCIREDQATTDPILPSNQQSIPEIKLISFSSVYIQNNYNQNFIPVFMWDNVPGNESDSLKDHLKSLEYNWVENAQITKTNEYLFCWDEVLVNELFATSQFYFQDKLLSDFLQKYGGNWVLRAKIEKSDDNRTINVFDENQSLSLKLNDEKTSMVLTTSDGSTEEFLVNIEGGKLNVYGAENKTIRIFSDENSIMVILRSNTSAVLVDTFEENFPVKEEDGKIILYDIRSTLSHNSTEKYYAVYNLSITNNGLKTFYFTTNDMNLRMGDQIFNTIPVELREVYPVPDPMVENAIISPGQNLTGCIIFQVNSPYDKSFQLLYNSTPTILESFEKTVEVLTISEYFDYSTVFDTPQFNVDNKKNVYMDDLEPDDLYPAVGSYPLIWPNWVDRDAVEFYKELDSQNLLKYPENYGRSGLPSTRITYELSVMPNRNITIMSVDRSIIIIDGNKEVINGTMDYVAILSDQTYELYSENIPQMNFSNATIVQTEFYNWYGWGLAARMTINNQIVIFDKDENMVIAMSNPGHFVS